MHRCSTPHNVDSIDAGHRNGKKGYTHVAVGADSDGVAVHQHLQPLATQRVQPPQPDVRQNACAGFVKHLHAGRGTQCILKVQRTTLLNRSEEHTSEITSLMSNTYAVYCLK